MPTAKADLIPLPIPARGGRDADLVSLTRALAAHPALTSLDPAANRLLSEILDTALTAQATIEDQKTRIRQLESLCVTDELTGLLNRRGFLEALQRRLEEARRYKTGGLLAYIDLDGFKEINDTYGHEAGDQLLKAVARILKTDVRSTDHLARLGGDEFAVLFVNAKKMPGGARLTGLCRTLNETRIDYRGHVLAIRASMGIEAYGPGSVLEDVIHGADQAMYRAKTARKGETAPVQIA